MEYLDKMKCSDALFDRVMMHKHGDILPNIICAIYRSICIAYYRKYNNVVPKDLWETLMDVNLRIFMEFMYSRIGVTITTSNLPIYFHKIHHDTIISLIDTDTLKLPSDISYLSSSDAARDS